jgi:hypothetical protein
MIDEMKVLLSIPIFKSHRWNGAVEADGDAVGGDFAIVGCFGGDEDGGAGFQIALGG